MTKGKKTVLPSNKEIYTETLKLIHEEKIFFLITGNCLEELIEAAAILKQKGFNLIGLDFAVPKVKDELRKFKKTGKKDYGVFNISTKKETRIAINAGARFVFSKNFEKGTIKRCKKEKVFNAIGAITPTEVFNTFNHRADAVSIYPCEMFGGTNWIEFIHRNYPQIRLIPTDKLETDKIIEYLKLNIFAVGTIIETQKVSKLEQLAESLKRSRDNFSY